MRGGRRKSKKALSGSSKKKDRAFSALFLSCCFFVSTSVFVERERENESTHHLRRSASEPSPCWRVRERVGGGERWKRASSESVVFRVLSKSLTIKELISTDPPLLCPPREALAVPSPAQSTRQTQRDTQLLPAITINSRAGRSRGRRRAFP